jgi:hypothetical protein
MYLHSVTNRRHDAKATPIALTIHCYTRIHQLLEIIAIDCCSGSS